MSESSVTEPLAAGAAALEAGRWADARATFETSLTDGETGEACFGLAVAQWWLGESRVSVGLCTRAYALFRESNDVPSAVQCAVWLCITYKANFSNAAAANGWIARADRLLDPLDPGPLHGYAWLARAYRMPDLVTAEQLTAQAVTLARTTEDTDLELVALSQLGLIQVAAGQESAGFDLLDEAMAAALAGERSSLDTVVYTCCDMLHACELTSDLERASQWCEVADEFVSTYGCPFLYAECRIYYGSVLAAKGRWTEAELELDTALRMTDGACPGLHTRALIRLGGLRTRQGRLEEADYLLSGLDEGVDVDNDAALSRAALLLARGDAVMASRGLEQRLHHLVEHRSHLATATELLVDAYLALGEVASASTAAQRLTDVAADRSIRLSALVASVHGRVAYSNGDAVQAVAHLEAALAAWSRAGLPFEIARAHFDLGRALAASHPDVAIEHGSRALASFDALGASLDADRTAAFLRSHGVAARSGPRGIGTLTARELEVLRLVGAGLSNPEIAARLFVSRKTAAHHVSNILAKLNLRNRAEAAAYAVGVLGPSGTPVRRV